VIPASADMLARASKHHAPRWRAVTSDGQDWTRLLIEGRIGRDSGQSPRARLGFTLAERGKPGLLDQGLLPLGRDVSLRYRIHPYSEEIIIAGGRLTSSALQRDSSTWAMEAVDWAGVVAEDVTDPAEWTSRPATVDALIRAIIARTLPAAVFDITGPSIGANVPAELEMDGDPWRIIEGLAQGTGSEAFFRPDGALVVRGEPGIGTPMDWLKVGNDGTITGYEAQHGAAYSRVEIRYEDQSDPPVVVLGVWEDHRADSPTSVERIGRATLREDHGGLLGLPSPAQADANAAALARRAAGRGRRLVVRHIPRPWIEPGDTIQVTLSGGPTELQMVESVDIPVGPGVQVTTLRNHGYVIAEGGAR
jgi:hypothetical protein